MPLIEQRDYNDVDDYDRDAPSSQDYLDPKKRSRDSKSSNSHVTVTEDTPLLRTQSPPSAGEVIELSKPRLKSTRWIIPICMVIVVLSQAADQLMATPFVRVYESIYCYQYWEAHDPSKLLLSRSAVGPGAIGGVDEALCKVPAVQAQVATLGGNLGFFVGIPSLVLAIPFGILADRWGRRPIILLGLCSFPLSAGWITIVAWFWQTFDLRLIWLSALHGILGGSSTVISAMFLTLLSDIVAEESRASVFFQVNSCSLAMNFFVPPVAAFLMDFTPWIPIFTGQILQAIPIALMMFVPETIHHHRASLADIESPLTREPGMKHPDGNTWLAPVRSIANMLSQDWRVSALASTFLIHIYTLYNVTQLLLQYVSTRYHISLTQGTFLVSLRAGFTIAVYLVLLPSISHVMIKRWGYNGRRKDLFLARACTVLSSVGWFLVALAPDVWFFTVAMFVLTLGAGYSTLVRSFITSLVSTGDVAKLYTTLSVLDTLGSMAGGPLCAWLFEVGLGHGDVGMGLPFLCIGLLYAVVSILAFCVAIRRCDRGEQSEDDVTAG